MALVDVNVNDAVELKVMEAGEYQLRCMGAEVKTSQNGNDYLNLRFEIPDATGAEDIFHIMMFPDGGDARRDNKRKLALIAACQAMDVEYSSGINTDDFLGKSCWAILTIESDAEYGDKNRIRSFVKGA